MEWARKQEDVDLKEKRLDYLDMTKGIGIILVVIGHSGMASDGVVTWLASFHMPLFLILSGMLLYHKKEETRPLRNSVKRKARSLLVPYGFFSIIYLVIDLWYIRNGQEIHLEDALLQVVSFYGLSVLWFLSSLFIGEILFLIIRKALSFSVTAICCCGLGLASILLKRLYELYYISEGSLFLLWLGYLMQALIRSGIAVIFLAAGYYLMWLMEKEKVSQKISGIWYLLAAVVFFAANLWIAYGNDRVDLRFMIFGNPVLYFGGAFLGSMAVLCLCKALPSLKVLAYLGSNSLIIMLTHLDCMVMYMAHRIAYFIKKFIPFGREYTLWLYVALALLAMEMVIIYVVNRFFPFLLGRSFSKEHSEQHKKAA